MATSWAIIVLGWLLSPVIRSVLPKILSYLGFDASKKLRELQIHFIPELENTLRAVDQERMLERGNNAKSAVSTLDDMAGWLRHAREDAKDIFDDAQHMIVARDILYGPVKTSIARFNSICLWIARIVRGGVVRLLKFARSSSLFNFLRSLEESLPVTAPAEPIPVPASAAPSDEQALQAATIAAPSDEQAVPVTAPLARWLSCLCSSFDFFKNCCTSIFYWFVDTFKAACFYRDWSYEVVGITGYQENASVFDSLLTAISRRNLKKRIEKVESTISEVKNSPLLGVASKSTPKDIADRNRSRIRTASIRKVFGREGLRDAIMAKLRGTTHCDAPSLGTSPCYSVIGIYGVAGSGKTTFARYIRDYIKEKCKEEGFFDTIICIHLSETFSVDGIFHEMLKDITKDQHSNISDREELEDKLKESLFGKRFCLILDDLWVKTKNDQQLEELISPFNVGKKGSKILVTARTKVAAEALCVDEPIKLPDLDEDQYLSMFMHYALGGTSVVDEEFKQVGRVIAEKLHQSPIAAVIVAGRLGANRDIRFWKSTADHDMLNDTMDALWWSYQQLSPDIRRCFEYCNIFPRRFKMKKYALIHLWIAQGFVKTSCAVEDMEAIAEGYIQELVSCSFLQQEETWRDANCFRIHDLLHDLADLVTASDYFRIENEGSLRTGWKGIPRDVCHLFVQNYDAELIIEKILGLGNLRTLIINVVGRDTQVEEKVINSICKKLRKLRVLAFGLSEVSLKETQVSVPESICQLKYVHYLAFRTDYLCKITLPSTLNKLQHIQLLDFGQGEILEYTFAELVNLRHIFCRALVKLPYVGRLSSLQTLIAFKVSNEQGCELKQLRDLNKLRGELHISGLENVKSKGQALESNLAAKRLTKLTLQWGFDYDARCSPEVEADVLDGLCPPVGLQTLSICSFIGLRYPDWMMGKNNGSPKYLQELRILDCRLPVPPSGFAEAFPHLRVLTLANCRWNALPGNMEHLTSLKKLWISTCRNIRSLPSLPQSLENFMLVGCNVEFSKSCKTVGHLNWQKIGHIPEKLILSSST